MNKVSVSDISIRDSFKANVIGESNTAMVYGFCHCHYDQVKLALSLNKTVEDVLTYIFARDLPEYSIIEDREVEKIPFYIIDYNDTKEKIKKECKTAITDLVLENIKRDSENLPLVPLLFVVDVEDNPFPVTAQSLSSKEDMSNYLVTYAELRRCYKLANTFENKKVREIANKTFKFLKLVANEDGKYSPVEIEPIWKSDPETHKQMQKRKLKPKGSKRNNAKLLYWREELMARVNKLDLKDQNEQPSYCPEESTDRNNKLDLEEKDEQPIPMIQPKKSRLATIQGRLKSFIAHF